MELSDLISGCKKRELKAEREFFYAYAKKVHALSRKYTLDMQEADDMMQECFIRVYSQMDKFEESKGNFEAWMYRVCVNTILQIIRAKKIQYSSIPVESIPDIAEDTNGGFEEVPHELLQTAMNGLPKGYKDIFCLFVMEGWSHKQIAAHMNITEGTSRSQLTKAKRYLRQFIHQHKNQFYEKSEF